MIKHGAIRDPSLLDRLESAAPFELPELIAANVRVKAAIIAADPEERTGRRALLNFGHTVGHAIENAAGYGRFLHGEAISLGLAAACRLSVRKAGLDPGFERRILALLRRFHLPVRLDPDLATETLLTAMGGDKKFERGGIRFVLLRAPGDAVVSREVTLDDIRAAIESLRGSAPEGA